MKGFNFNFFTPQERALLITLLLHLVLVLVLVSKKTPKTGSVEEIFIALEMPEPEPEKPEEAEVIKPLVPDNQREITNRASNQNSQEEEQFNTPKPDPTNGEETGSDPSDLASSILKEYQKKKGKPDAQPSDNTSGSKPFGGVSNIYYDLPGRTDDFIPNPIYLCEEGGKIVVDILVDWTGTVIRAEVDKSRSTRRRFCLYNEAVKAAYQTKFNSYDYFEEEERGTMTFIFKTQ